MAWLIIAFAIVTIFIAISNALSHTYDINDNYSAYVKWKAITLIGGYIDIMIFIVMIGQAVAGESI